MVAVRLLVLGSGVAGMVPWWLTSAAGRPTLFPNGIDDAAEVEGVELPDDWDQRGRSAGQAVRLHR
jgi:hypothetical protein